MIERLVGGKRLRSHLPRVIGRMAVGDREVGWWSVRLWIVAAREALSAPAAVCGGHPNMVEPGTAVEVAREAGVEVLVHVRVTAVVHGHGDGEASKIPSAQLSSGQLRSAQLSSAQVSSGQLRSAQPTHSAVRQHR